MYNTFRPQQSCCGSNFIVPEGAFPAETPLAMAYVPFQSWEETYPENKALETGTIFPSLDMPFKGRQLIRQ